MTAICTYNGDKGGQAKDANVVAPSQRCPVLWLPLREFLAMVGSEKVRATNMNCDVTATVKHNKSEPVVEVTYGECCQHMCQ